ncbi:MAG: Sensor protein kinase WalK [Syntrophorhabdus sp. PtaU1.Bin153]|nr:MAG: Sensor protein kinase WalK [Syntrophorhabdus sp. PtaU1.Bin153]
MKKSLFSRIFGGYLIIICILLLLIPLISFKLIRAYFVDALTENLKNVAITTSPQIVSFLDSRRHKDLDAFLKNLKNKINTRITVIDKEGTVLADTEKNPAAMESHKMRPEVVEALSGGVGKSMRFSVTLEEEMLYVALPVEKDREILGAVRMSIPLKEVGSLLRHLQIRIIIAIAVITLLSVTIALLLSRGLSKPVSTLVGAAKNLARGEFHTRVRLPAQGELKDLAATFNEMAGRIEGLFGSLSRKNEELDTIISSIQEILLVLDKDGRIKLTNESFQKIFDGVRTEDKFYWEVMRCPDFTQLVKRVIEERKNHTREIEFKNRQYLCSITFISSKEEMVAVLYDITELKKLERIKKEFVANISHELRTPLTAIKGFVETLEEEEEIKNVQYLDIIKRHTDRLMNIVNDLLVLSEVEQAGNTLEVGDVNLANLAENILRVFEQGAKEKGLTLKLVMEKTLQPIQADPFKLEQMFINLLDNAIKYTEKGEVSVTLTQRDAKSVIEIQDTGIGIPGSHVSRIFERFYVVDKSRSKKLGGTGLGLSIVKHIVLLHGGTIDVESSPGVGTKFTIILPTHLVRGPLTRIPRTFGRKVQPGKLTEN